MKFSCEKQKLSEAINNVSRAVAARSTIVALEGIKMAYSSAGKILHLTGYDLELAITTSIPVTPEESGDGSFVVNARLFADMVRKMPADQITIQIDENYYTTVTGGAVTYNIMSLSAEEYPELPEYNSKDSFTIAQPLLRDMIEHTVFAAATSDARPILTGELFDVQDNIFHLVAIDGSRLAVRQERLEDTGDYHFVVPAKALKEAAALLKDEISGKDKDRENSDKESGDPEEEVPICTLYPGKKQIAFSMGGCTLIARLLEGNFHNYRGAIPETSATEALINTREWIQGLERCLLLNHDKMQGPVRCRFMEGVVHMTCQTGLGKVEDAVWIEKNGPDVEIGFNCRYLLDAIKASGDDKIKLQMNGPLAPMKIVPLDGNDYIFLVLPVRLKAE